MVVNTGINTYFGKTAELVKIAKPKSHQEEVMILIVKNMMYLAIVALIIVLIYGLVMNIQEHLVTVLHSRYLSHGSYASCTTCSPYYSSGCRSNGACKKGALVTRIDSIEDAASIDVLCLDKTSTITQNKWTVIDSIALSEYKKEDVIAIAAMASQEEGMDIIDLAVIENARSMGIDLGKYKQLSFTPFNPSIKRTEAIVESERQKFRAIKGAAQIVLSLCRDIDQPTLENAKRAIEDFSHKGYRTIVVAKSEGDDFDNLKLVGLIPLSDPLRPDSKEMIEEAKKPRSKANDAHWR